MDRKGQFFRRTPGDQARVRTNRLGLAEPRIYQTATRTSQVRRTLASATIIDSPTQVRLVPENAATNVYKVIYASERDFNRLRFGVFAEWKDGVPRAGYRGVVTFKMYKGRATVMLVPAPSAAVARTYAQWTGTLGLEEPGGGAGVSSGVGTTTTTTKGTAGEPPEAKKEATKNSDDGLSEEERNSG